MLDKWSTRLCSAVTLRLAPTEFNEVVRGWLAASLDGELPTWIGQSAAVSLRRRDWAADDLVQLVQLVFAWLPSANEAEDRRADDLLEASEVYHLLGGWVDFAALLEVGRLVRPPCEPTNQSFWFDLLCCNLDSEVPMFQNAFAGLERIVAHARSLSAAALSVLLAHAADQEVCWYVLDFDDEERSLSHRFSRAIAESWATANGFPSCASCEERAALANAIAALPNAARIKVQELPAYLHL